MDEQDQEDWLDRRLREEMPYIDDAGFTARVLQELPAARPRPSYRAVILIGVTLLASVIAYLISDGGHFLIVEAYRLTTLPVSFVGFLVICVSLALTALAASAAWNNVREQR